MSQFPTDPEEILRRDDSPGDFRQPPQHRLTPLERLKYGVLWVAGMAGLAYVAYDFFDLAPKPPPPPRVPAELRVIERKAISTNEELRIVWMPDEFGVLGYRCLLYQHTQTGATSLSCPSHPSLPDDERQ